MEVGMMALKTFANPSINILKTIPQGIIEIVLRIVAIVSIYIASYLFFYRNNMIELIE